MRYVLFFMIIAVVAVSGCSIDSGPGFVMGNGLQINSFQFKPANIAGGQSTLLTVEVQNAGSRDIGNAYLYVYGLTTDGEEGKVWTGEIVGGQYAGGLDEPINLEYMRAASQELQTEGQKKIVAVKCKSPKEEFKGTDFVHKAYLRACYDYATDAMIKVETIGEDEWLLKEQTGSYSQHAIQVKQTAAPVQINVESMQPIIVDETMIMEVLITNVGGGVAFSGNKDCEGILEADTDDDFDFDLNSVTFSGLENCRFLGENDGGIISLARGEERSVTLECDGFSSSMPEQEFNLNIRLDYYYYMDSETSVVVTGVQEESEPASTSDWTQEEEKEEEEDEEAILDGCGTRIETTGAIISKDDDSGSFECEEAVKVLVYAATSDDNKRYTFDFSTNEMTASGVETIKFDESGDDIIFARTNCQDKIETYHFKLWEDSGAECRIHFSVYSK